MEVDTRAALENASDGEKVALAAGAALVAPVVVPVALATVVVSNVVVVAGSLVAAPFAVAAAGASALQGDEHFHEGPCSLTCSRCELPFHPLAEARMKEHCRQCKRCVCRGCLPHCCSTPRLTQCDT